MGTYRPSSARLPRHDLGDQGQSQRVEVGHHDLDLQEVGIVLAMPELEEAVLASLMVSRDRSGIKADALGNQIVDADSVLGEIFLDGLPIVGFAQVAQDAGQAVVGKIGVSYGQSGDALQGLLGLGDPFSDGEFSGVALRENVGEPDGGDPSPTQSLLEPMAGQMAIQEIGQLDLQHDMNEQDQIIDAFGGECE